MAFAIDDLMRLWTEPVGDQMRADEAFRAVYADPVVVNGSPLSVSGLVGRARALQEAYTELTHDIVDQVYTRDRVVIGFRLRGRHVGPLHTPLGVVPATGRMVENRATDILTLDGEGRVTAIWVVSDDLNALIQLDAVRLAD
jgi:hypothetical protein